MAKLKGLGRGLDALLASDSSDNAASSALRDVDVARLAPGKYQPRSRMDEASLQSLAASIRSQGIMQPIIVRELGGDRFEIIAGERRWRAAQLAGLSEVPVVVRSIADEAALAMSLIENIQREDLNPLEEATGIQRLIDEFGMTHQSAADAVGRSRSAVTNLLRLLQLAPRVQHHLAEQSLDMGHARALLALTPQQQVELAELIIAQNLSVRETEKRVQKLLSAAPQPSVKAQKTRDIVRLEEDLSEKLGTTVKLQHNQKKSSGRLVIQYSDLEELDRLIRGFDRT